MSRLTTGWINGVNWVYKWSDEEERYVAVCPVSQGARGMTCNEFRSLNYSTEKFLTLTRAERLASHEHFTSCVGCSFWVQMLEPDPGRDYATDAAECHRLWMEDHKS